MAAAKNSKQNAAEIERLEANQIQVLQLMGQSLLFEENQALGFLPLRSYFESKKDKSSCKKACPQDKEDLVRSLI